MPRRGHDRCSRVSRSGLHAANAYLSEHERFARIEIIESIAVVHLEVQRWSGKLAGAYSRASDVFTLLKWNGDWKVTHKLFHWHER